MVASIRGYTPNYSFKLVNFDTPRWHTLEYANWNQVDSLLLQAGIPQIRGDWLQGTLYYVGDRVFDADIGSLYRCLVQHTSAVSGTFAQDRAAHPTYWTLQTAGVPIFRGVWQPSATYAIGDIVVVNSYSYYLCITGHMSAGTFPPDAGKWTLIFDASAAVNAANASAVAAANSATAAATSATNASNSATAAAGSATESAAQAQKLYGTSTTTVPLGLGGKTFITQADKYFNVGKFVMVRADSNPVDMWMWGQVAAYAGSSLTINCQTFAGAGSFASWTIDVSGARGASVGGPGSSSLVTTADVPPATPSDGDMWFKTDVGVMYVYYDDGDSQQWVQTSAVPNTVGVLSVENDQNFTEVQKAQGRENIYAAPFDAMAYNGMQINGSMEVSQELGTAGYSFAAGASSMYICDGWKFIKSGTAVQSVLTYDGAIIFPGFRNTFIVATTTGQSSFLAGDYNHVLQCIEGYRVSRLAWGTPNAQSITISFWIKHFRTGTYSVAIRNFGGSRSYVTTYTQNVADTTEYKTVTIPGCVDGVWEIGANVGLYLSFSLGAGTTQTAPSANVWINGNYTAAPTQVNAVATTSDAFRMTGVVVLPGIEAPSAERSALIMRPYDQELLTCQRYFYRRTSANVGGDYLGVAHAYTTGAAFGVCLPLPVIMRAIPTSSISAPGHFSPYGPTALVAPAFTVVAPICRDDRSIIITDMAGSSGLVANTPTTVAITTQGGWIQADARL